MIRDATHSDIPRIAALGERFFHAAEWPGPLSWCTESIVSTLTRMIDMPEAILVVGEADGEIAGMAGGMVYQAYFNALQRLGSELFWYVEPAHRGTLGPAMMRAMEARAKDMGCDAWLMGSVPSQKPEAIARLYARRGYRPAENTFIKVL